MFQSSIDPKADRYTTGIAIGVGESGSNPRSTRKPIATKPFGFGISNIKFQSSIDPKADRYLGIVSTTLITLTFQSSIDPKADRYVEIKAAEMAIVVVPILDRPESRSLLKRF